MRMIIYLTFILTLSQLTFESYGQSKYFESVEFTNGKWFIDNEFKSLAVYSINGVFSFNKPEKIDTTVNLQDSYIIPPLAEAHNHNIGTGVIDWDKRAIRNYLDAGVFYVKIQGNLPVSQNYKDELNLNRPGTLDVQFAHGNITATNGHPISLVHNLHKRGYYKGTPIESLENLRYFTMDTEDDISNKWPLISKYNPDFIKIMLINSDQYDRNINDTSIWYKGLNPKLVHSIVEKVHHNGLRITAHINNTFDFHHMLVNKVDEIAHMPRMISGFDYKPISADDAKLAAKNETFILTTLAVSLFQGGTIKKEDIPLAKKYQADDLAMLNKHGALLAIGSDDPTDTSVKEAMYIKDLGIFDNLTLLKIWTENTPKTILPKRKVGLIQAGYEANFISLKGNPIENFESLTKINTKFKQGYFIE
jgi:(2Fe-2S) ferredoxin